MAARKKQLMNTIPPLISKQDWDSKEPLSFYKNRGWQEVGMHEDDEIKFEMTSDEWKKRTTNR
jgi:hypothetical protein